MAIVKANYLRMSGGGASPDRATGGRRRVGRAMAYYSHRPGDDLEQRDDGRRPARDWYTADGERVPLRTARDRVEHWLEARDAGPDPRVYRIVLSTSEAVLTADDLATTLRRGLGRRDPVAAERWAYCRHDAGSHPHVHVVALTDHRGLDRDDLRAMREALGERERCREQELHRVVQAREPQEYER